MCEPSLTPSVSPQNGQLLGGCSKKTGHGEPGSFHSAKTNSRLPRIGTPSLLPSLLCLPLSLSSLSTSFLPPSLPPSLTPPSCPSSHLSFSSLPSLLPPSIPPSLPPSVPSYLRTSLLPPQLSEYSRYDFAENAYKVGYCTILHQLLQSPMPHPFRVAFSENWSNGVI